jgi:hypothetical protein
MLAVRRFELFVLLIAASLGPIACGSWQPPAPTAPSQFTSAPASGAVVMGVVNGGQTSSKALMAAQSTTEMTVRVVGTNITAPVSVSGTFVLRDVPSGSVRLEFTAPGINAVIDVTTVAEHEQIDIRVTVSGNRGTLDSCMRVRDDDEVEIEGEVTQVSGTCPSLTIVVHGTAVRLNVETEGSCANVRVGVRIKIKGHHNSSTIVVVSVEVGGSQPSPQPTPPGDGHHGDDDDD